MNQNDNNKRHENLPEVRHIQANHLIKDNRLRFLYFKSERLSSGIYLVTAHLSDDEPLKRSLRDTSLSLVSFMHDYISFSLYGIDGADAELGISSILFEINSLLSITHASGLVDQSHVEIIQREIGTIYRNLEAPKKDELVLPESFFDVEELLETKNENEEKLSSVNIKEKIERKKEGNKKNVGIKKEKKRVSLDQKNQQTKERQDKIVKFLRDNGESTVRDIMDTIGSGYSKKTIQRDLNALSNEGVVSKMGTKRWTSYVLN